MYSVLGRQIIKNYREMDQHFPAEIKKIPPV
jgi:hypothetical protein